ncbi:MAG: fused MFS/spermidine synthase [Deltaproteobacteria bacterium]|nr:fused MFS/spermidine synthase [Deltaproteobacteria bacterium]
MGRYLSIGILGSLALLGTAAAGERRVVHQEPSAFGRIYVVDEGDLRYLRYDGPNGDDQSVISISDPGAVPMDYIRDALLGLALVPNIEQVLMIGLGAGTFTTFLFHQLPKVKIDAVEINPVVVRLAKDFFRLPSDPCYRIHKQDGRKFIESSRIKYDLIFIDAYTGLDLVPKQLAGEDFFKLVKAHLVHNGLAIINLSVEEKQEEKVWQAFKNVFGKTLCLETAEQDNLLLFGFEAAELPEPKTVRAAAARLTKTLKLPFDLGQIAERVGEGCGMGF